ncbi:MAG: GGDEF domain-containing protein [Helicobacteraceae bacterium]|jgi:diguanylate cyclase (GGDEF)-like protein|nr:GGDEF domain-containing protein [Helicobacteraceae bacterium]
MQISIFKIFGTIKSLFMVALLLVILLFATILSEYASFYKLENLQKQKELATAVYSLSREDLDISNIQFRGSNNMLKHEGEALASIYDYDYINRYSKSNTYINDLTKLQYAIRDFNIASASWYTQEEIDAEELQTRKEAFTKTYQALMTQISTVTSQNITFEKRRFLIELGVVIALLFIIILGTFWVYRRLTLIQKDITSLHAADHEEISEFATSEADTISKQMGRSVKSPMVQNPAYLDSVTGINNFKGFLHEFSDKKSQKVGNYTAICIFAIDKLNELEMQYSQEFTELIIKKVSFMLSLYRQHNDVIGRIEHNQFTIILSRQDKTSAINDCELIRKSVEETPFKTADGKDLTVTLSGAFVQKMSTQTLDEILKKANKILLKSIQYGGNRIAQLRDKSTALK